MTDEWDEDECDDEDDFEDEFGAAEAFDLEEQENAVEWARGGYANQARLERQRDFQLAAQYVAMALSSLPAVKRVVLFGSVALASFLSGVVYNEWGWDMLNWVIFPVVVICLAGLGALVVLRRNAAVASS